MAKFNIRLIEKGKTWTAEITRKISARKTSVTKRKTRFASEKDANDWAQAELLALSDKVSKRRRAVKIEKEQAAKEAKEKQEQLEKEQKA
ncbi:MAG: DUF3622 domain-containing protein [Enterobacterales bacterium]|nr:DUF3622 domain-containing protein [Enterobacterales bacterium]